MNSATVKADLFLKEAGLFQLGGLPTEGRHQKTLGLSRLAKDDLPQAIAVLQKVDVEALLKLHTYLPLLTELSIAVKETLASGGRIFLCGCGATGRLSLSLEGFEDFTDYGAEHLLSLGFTENDLLISSTEGGETSFVIGATEKALELSKRKPFFLYCNPRELLISQVERSRRVLLNSRINSICLDVGPMALSVPDDSLGGKCR